MKFDSLNLDHDILKGIADVGFTACTPVQEQSLPESLKGRDVIVQAQTGTGKTAVFLLTICQNFITNKTATAESKSQKRGPGALIMVPTRELASQVDQDAKNICKYLPFASLAVYGGVGYEKQETALDRGVDIIVATPGRMIDLFKSKTLSLEDIEMFVIDEADRMLDMGFLPDIRYILDNLPKDKEIQTMLFSATINNDVQRISSQYMKHNAALIEIEPEQITVDAIEQKIIYVSNEEKFSTLITLLKRPEAKKIVIFTNMKITAEKVGWKLTKNNLLAHVLTGDVSQNRRLRTIMSMKSGDLKILVATDVAARGLHIDGITHVVNYDLPEDAANYVHRIGRTARAGQSGIAYSLVCEDHVLNLPEIEKYIGRKIDTEWIDESEMVKDTAEPYRRSKNSRDERKNKSAGKRMSERKNKDYKSSPKKPCKTGIAPKPDKSKQKVKKPRSNKPLTPEERLAYYKKKYGEDFKFKSCSRTTQKSSSENKEGGLLNKILNLFGK